MKYGMSRLFYLKKSTMFTKSRFCKIYKVTSENPPAICPIPTIICRFGISPEAAVSIGWRGKSI